MTGSGWVHSYTHEASIRFFFRRYDAHVFPDAEMTEVLDQMNSALNFGSDRDPKLSGVPETRGKIPTEDALASKLEPSPHRLARTRCKGLGNTASRNGDDK